MVRQILYPVLQGARMSSDNFVAVFDSHQGAERTIASLAGAYETISKGEDRIITHVLKTAPMLHLLSSSSTADETEVYLSLIERFRGLSILLQEDPTGKSVLEFTKSELLQQPPNLDSSKGLITRFTLRGVEYIQRSYTDFYDKAD